MDLPIGGSTPSNIIMLVKELYININIFIFFNFVVCNEDSEFGDFTQSLFYAKQYIVYIFYLQISSFQFIILWRHA